MLCKGKCAPVQLWCHYTNRIYLYIRICISRYIHIERLQRLYWKTTTKLPTYKRADNVKTSVHYWYQPLCINHYHRNAEPHTSTTYIYISTVFLRILCSLFTSAGCVAVAVKPHSTPFIMYIIISMEKTVLRLPWASWLPEVANLPLPESRADNGVGCAAAVLPVAGHWLSHI